MDTYKAARKSQRGAVLIVGLVMLAVMTLLVVSMLKTSVLELKIGGANQVAALNFSNAELAVTKFINDNAGLFAHGFLTNGTVINTPPTVDGGTVAVVVNELACTDYAPVGSGYQVGSGLQAVYFDANATATGTITGGSASVHQGIQSLAPPGACDL